MNKIETIVVNLINKRVTKNDRKSPDFKIAEEIASKILVDFKGIVRCEHIGSDYSDIGDILLFNPEKKYIELKLLTSSSEGKGTLANISQNFLSDYKLINHALGWMEWRLKNKYDQKVTDYLDEFDYGKKLLSKDNKARYLRNKIIKNTKQFFKTDKKALPPLLSALINDKNKFKKLDSKTKQAIGICKKIIDLARQDLKEYVKDCSNKEVNIERFYKFVTLLKFGYHTKPLLEKYLEVTLREILDMYGNYYIYYYYTRRGEGDRIKIETPDELKKYIPRRIEVKFKDEGIDITDGERVILYFKFHWRNVFFGIATPSVEVFDRKNNL